MTADRPLEPDDAELRALLGTRPTTWQGCSNAADHRAVDMSGVAELVADPALLRPPPEEGRPLDELLGVLDRAAAKGHITPSGGHMGYIPGGGIVGAAVAELVADVLNRYTGLAAAGPGLVALETTVLRWLADLFDLPDSAGGILTTGGSLAAFSAVVTARHARLPEDFLAGTLYVTEQAHQSVAKAARLAGFPDAAIRTVPADEDQRMDVEAVRAAVRADRADGRLPFCLVATAGTTNTGAVDPLPELARLAATGAVVPRRRGVRRVLPAHRARARPVARHRAGRLAGARRAQGDVPAVRHRLPAGPRRRAAPERALRSVREYLQDIEQTGLPDFADISPELTRDSRGIRVWLPLHLHGVAAFRDALDEKLDLAAHAYETLAADPNLSVLGRPELSIVGYHVRLPGRAQADEDEATAELLRRVNAEGRGFLSSTRIGGRYVGRMAILNVRTDRARVDEVLDSLRRHAAELAAGPGA